MKTYKKKLLRLGIGLWIVVALCNAWSLQKVAILYVSHMDMGNIDIVVGSFPLTDNDRIYWYLNHKAELMKLYPVLSQSYRKINIWDVGEGFKAIKASPEANDLYCFDDKAGPYNCIVKNIVLVVSQDEAGRESFDINNSGLIYTLNQNGEIRAERDDDFFIRLNARLGYLF